ncbi:MULTISPECIES: hypothetical protein [Planktothricoides]|uniref:Uncharacterized protein n=1 Tax=Planktothricoides raciborskii FACHB-1370 TaxID=2949576 RepID=A0ABR8EL65_9CYAN|nr:MULTISPECIES: hypothetical protein [Planktothricoides]MBD2547285.1 hypothetical protein [Planktothricoides raciborskii FACHB-1370]MBD2585633.1 hypothetical protein [Planktothricoides raciborskii FACHB-1261]
MNSELNINGVLASVLLNDEEEDDPDIRSIDELESANDLFDNNFINPSNFAPANNFIDEDLSVLMSNSDGDRDNPETGSRTNNNQYFADEDYFWDSPVQTSVVESQQSFNPELFERQGIDIPGLNEDPVANNLMSDRQITEVSENDVSGSSVVDPDFFGDLNEDFFGDSDILNFTRDSQVNETEKESVGDNSSEKEQTTSGNQQNIQENIEENIDPLTGAPFNDFLADPNVQENLLAYFNEQWYRQQNPDVDAAIAQGFLKSGLEHFILFGQKEGRPSNPFFDETDYLTQNPDVNQAVISGFFQSGVEHFLIHGLDEGRNPGPGFDSNFYLNQNPDVAQAIQNGAFDSAFEHFLLFGQREGRISTGET